MIRPASKFIAEDIHMSKRLARFLASTVTALTKLQRPERAMRNRLLVRDFLTARHVIQTKWGPLTLICKERREAHYAHHFFDREPETLNWIDDFEPPCTFWDVGANTGIYSLYAALREDIKVYAFEPASSSYAALNANIHANGLDDRIVGLCIGFNDKTVLGEMTMSTLEAGSALHGFGAAAASAGSNGPAEHIQSTLAFSIDDFRRLYPLEPINYLKIDVDSVEEEILHGATETLGDENIRSVLIEIADEKPERNSRMVEFLERCGFTNRTEFDGAHNVIFSR